MLRRKSIFTTLLAGLLALVVLCAGCGAPPAPAATSAATGTSAETASASAAASSEPAETNPLATPMTLSIAYWGIDGAIPDGVADPLYDKLKTDFNITIEKKPTTWTDWTEKIQLWAAAGELPDIFATDALGKPDYANWVANGVVRAVPADLTPYSNMQKVYADPRAKVFEKEGKFYACPRYQYDSEKYMTAPSMFVRKDVYDAAKLARQPETMDELIAMLTAFKDIPVNGKKITPLTGSSANMLIQYVMCANNPAYFYNGGAGNTAYVQENGQWIPAFFSAKTLDGIKDLQAMYQAGLMDSDLFVSGNSANGLAQFAADNAAAFVWGADPNTWANVGREWDKAHPDKPFLDNVVQLTTMKAHDGVYYQYKESFWSESYFSSKVDDAKMDRIMRLYDFLYSQEGKDLFTLGIEGTDYTRSGDAITITRPKNDKGEFIGIAEMYPIANMMPNLATWYGEFNWTNPTLNPKIKEKTDAYLAWLDKASVAEADLNLPSFSAPLKDKFSYNAGNDDVIRITLGKEDPATAWAATLKKYEDAGYKAMVEEFNTMAKAAGMIP